jgi:hypothetical protein
VMAASTNSRTPAIKNRVLSPKLTTVLLSWEQP